MSYERFKSENYSVKREKQLERPSTLKILCKLAICYIVVDLPYYSITLCTGEATGLCKLLKNATNKLRSTKSLFFED